MITMHARPRHTDRRTNIMSIARRFVLRTHRALKPVSVCLMCVGYSAKCREPPLIHRASHSGSTAVGNHSDGRQRLYELGVQLIYSCAPGYYVHGFYKATCMAEGRWVGPKMTCRGTYAYIYKVRSYVGQINSLAYPRNVPKMPKMYRF